MILCFSWGPTSVRFVNQGQTSKNIFRARSDLHDLGPTSQNLRSNQGQTSKNMKVWPCMRIVWFANWTSEETSRSNLRFSRSNRAKSGQTYRRSKLGLQRSDGGLRIPRTFEQPCPRFAWFRVFIKVQPGPTSFKHGSAMSR